MSYFKRLVLIIFFFFTILLLTGCDINSVNKMELPDIQENQHKNPFPDSVYSYDVKDAFDKAQEEKEKTKDWFQDFCDSLNSLFN